MTDIVELLRVAIKDGRHDQWGLMEEAANEIARLREELNYWKARYEAEYCDHEATIKRLQG